ncbi:MAG TPA: sugar transferase [Bryobacteraceae bacterium]|nr:sugar transferase [Bryobacteraceae bacterium]
MLPSLQLERFPALRQITLQEIAERATGLFLLLLTSPLLIGSAVLVSVLSRRSPLVAHLRIGRHSRPFWMLKLRSMWDSREPASRRAGWIEYVIADPLEDGKEAHDPRVTSRFAAFCRRHSIDEIPQFWHVVSGEMSLVGPRPLTRAELVRHYGSAAAELMSVKPGLTGLWQVSGRSTIKYPERASLDLKLVRELTTKMYLTILLRTFSALVIGQGAW